jgi:hypothetical protein
MIIDVADRNLPAVLSEEAEEVLMNVAEHLGLLVTEEELAVIDKMLDGRPLSEVANIVRLNKQSKMSGLVVRSALVIAQQKKDSLFAKYAKAAELKRKIRALIVKKYSGQATITARKLLAQAGKRNLVDVSNSATFSHPESR